MADRADLLLGLFAGFIIGLLVGTWLFKAGILAAQPAQPKQYGVRYEYDEKGRLTNVIPVPVPG
ncbi:MAG: hypothetical protein QXO67_00385 [Candidatus Bathyarchaeia archaeon]